MRLVVPVDVRRRTCHRATAQELSDASAQSVRVHAIVHVATSTDRAEFRKDVSSSREKLLYFHGAFHALIHLRYPSESSVHEALIGLKRAVSRSLSVTFLRRSRSYGSCQNVYRAFFRIRLSPHSYG